MEKSSEKALFSCLKLLAFVVACFVLLSVLIPVGAKHREKERQNTCLNYIKHISMAINLYAQDNDGNLPGFPWTTAITGDRPTKIQAKKYDTWMENKSKDVTTTPYLDLGTKSLSCPGDPENGAVQVCSYGYSGSLLRLDATGINVSQIFAPAEVPLICDSNPSRSFGMDTYIPGGGLQDDATSNGYPTARHSKGINVGFCDGHVKYVPTDFTPADYANPVTKGFYECIPLGLLDNPGGGLPLSTNCTRQDYQYPNKLIIGGEYATMPLLAEMAEIWKRRGRNNIEISDYIITNYAFPGIDPSKINMTVHKPDLDYRNTGFQGEYSVKPASLSKNYLWGTVDDAAGTAIAHDALVVIVAKNTKLPPNNVGGLTTIANSSTPSNGWYCCNTATIAAWFTDGYAANQWQAYTYGTALATTGQLARYLALPAGKDHRPVFGTRCRVVNNDREMVARVANDPAGIGFCSSACVDYDRVQVVGIQDTAGKQYYFPNRDALHKTWLPNPYPAGGPVPDHDWPHALLRTLKIKSAGEGARIVLDLLKDGPRLDNGPLFACSYW